MGWTSYLGEFLAGLFFLIAGIRLLRLHRRTGERPEWQLGAYFTLAGLSYLVYVFPRMAGVAGLDDISTFASRVFYSLGVVPFVQFTRDVFRQQSRWSAWLTRCVMALLFAGVCGSAATGNLAGASSVWFWCYFLGYSAAIVWMTAEAILAHAAARRRRRIGLCAPRVANRFFLWACFGVFQTLACAVVIAWEFEYAESDSVSALMERLLSVSEIASIGAVWLAFFTPSAYQRWLERSSAEAERREGTA